jgi:uncharacterized membrane protein
MPLLTTLIGAVLGAGLGRGFDAMIAGGFIGLIAGLVFSAWRKSRGMPQAGASASGATSAATLDPLALLDPRVAERIRAMERRIATLEAALREAPGTAAAPAMPAAGVLADAVATPAADAMPAPQPLPGPVSVVPEAPARADERLAADTLREDSTVPPVPAYGAARSRAAGAAPPRQPGALWRFLTGGNTLARVGVVVLFIGVAFLLKYATEHVTIPIEVRLAGVALGGVVLLVLGWRLRGRRAGYAMSLQGAAIGVLYLTVFAALRLYQLLPPVAAFTLLFWIAALSSFLAIRQDSMALAVLGVVGGFAAPVLTSSAGASHVMLFSYYAVLNAAIFAIAWFKAWRLLNVVGFVCTFVVGTLWGVTRYRSEDFATTEPFLVLFFLFYVAIATLYAVRRSLEVKRYVDATLVFGTPLVAAGLQGALVRHIEYAMAWSALAAAAIYVGLARFLYTRHREDLRLLVESFLALGIVFATLAVPLALDARLTSATWALEGAALVWVGVRQRHLGPRAFGLALQLAAGIAFGLGLSVWTHRLVGGAWPVVNSDCIGALLVAGAGLASSRILARAPAATTTERSLVPVVFAWGVLWWLGGGWREIARFVASEARIAALVAFLAVSAVLFAALARRLAWPLARVPALLLPPALLLIALWRVFDVMPGGGHLLGAWGFAAWPFALAVHVLLLRHFERAPPAAPDFAIDAGHAILAWLVTLIIAHEAAWLARAYVSGAAWRLVPWGLVPALALMTICARTLRPGWPMGARIRAWLVIGASPLAAAALAWTLYANVASAGDAVPLPFVPLVNPLDLTQGFAFVAVGLWLRRTRDAEGMFAALAPEMLGAIAAGLALFWVTCSTLRTLHHWADVPWSLVGLWASRVVQAALSLVWSVFALAAMVIANRRRYRVAWIAGAALLGVVVAKLFFVDLSQVGGVERIVSFIGVGVLLLVVGYMAPVPPRQEAS